MRPLSGWYAQTQKRYGLVIGYTNIQSFEQARTLLARVANETRTLLAV
ncbi:hypothetical protein [Pantoea sp. B_10]|nr:hypothetical protein [Pantoea sp. B_10]